MGFKGHTAIWLSSTGLAGSLLSIRHIPTLVVLDLEGAEHSTGCEPNLGLKRASHKEQGDDGSDRVKDRVTTARQPEPLCPWWHRTI